MGIFKKRVTLAQNIAFMAIMAAINVIFVLLTTFIPFLLFLLVFLLPLSCTLVVLLCEKKYFPIYAFATIGLCLIVTIYNISDTIFYIIPSMITGFVFALFIEQKLSYVWSILAATFLQFGLSYALLPLAKLITTVDILETFSIMLNIQNYEYLLHVQVFGVFFVSFLQELVSYLFIKLGLRKMNISTNENNRLLSICIGLYITLFLTLLVCFVLPCFAYVLFFCSLYFSFFVCLHIFQSKNKLLTTFTILSLVITIFAIALLNGFVVAPFNFLLFEIFGYLVGIIGIINNCLVKRETKL